MMHDLWIPGLVQDVNATADPNTGVVNLALTLFNQGVAPQEYYLLVTVYATVNIETPLGVSRYTIPTIQGLETTTLQVQTDPLDFSPGETLVVYVTLQTPGGGRNLDTVSKEINGGET